jgi:hypothetical protein
LKEGCEMITTKSLPRNPLILAIALILLIPLQLAEATPVALFGSNLIRNGDAEQGDGSGSGYDVVAIPDWTRLGGNLTAVSYGAPGFPDSQSPGPGGRGANFFAGGPDSALSLAFQIINVVPYALEIDEGTVSFDMSGYFGGWEDHPDDATLTALFLDSNADVIGEAVIGPVSASDRGNITGLLFQDAQGVVPQGTRRIKVLLTMIRANGAYNDGYSDNLSLVLVPLPSTFVLFGAGMIGLLRYRRGSKRARRSLGNE